MNAYYAKNRERMIKQASEWRKANPDKIKAYYEATRQRRKEYYLKNREKIITYVKKYNAAHDDKIRKYRRTHRKKNAAYMREYFKDPIKRAKHLARVQANNLKNK